MQAYKSLRLLHPEHARQLGVPAEAPVFASRFIFHRVKCTCGRGQGYGAPLVYAIGHATRSLHCAPIFCEADLSPTAAGPFVVEGEISDDAQVFTPLRLVGLRCHWSEVLGPPEGEFALCVSWGRVTLLVHSEHSETCSGELAPWRLVVRDGVPLFTTL